MKITHSSGQEYHLSPETKLELTRYNPFFHDMGEQSIPISLPASDHNLALLKHPESTAGRDKIASRVDATIQSGIYSVNARQAILSAQKNGTIETSFYLREGAFYEKIKDISLQEIFEDKKIEFANIDAAIDFMYSLIATNDNRFACFEVITDNYILNESKMPLKPNGFKAFVKELETTETIDDKKITVPKGFYLTPFIKVKHLLEDVLAHFGYTLGPSFLNTAPFSDMCFLNDNIDSIVNNRIDYVAIVPNIMVSTLFDVLRKFNIEIIADEQNRVIHLKQFNEMVDGTIPEKLDNAYVGNLKVNYPGHKQIKLSSDYLALPGELNLNTGRLGSRTISTGATIDKNRSFVSILSQFPSVYLRKTDGAVIRDGINGDRMINEKIGSLAFDYYAGGILEVEEKKFPDVIPDIYTTISRDVYSVYPYVGAGRALYSSIQFSNEETSEDKKDNTELKPMLCFCYQGASFSYGTLYNYNYRGEKLWDYSLMYNGEDGIFEKFWRQRDDLLRNALLEVETDLLLTESQKFALSTMDKVSIYGQHYIISELKYTPETDSVEPCKLLTTKLQEPISTAKTESEYLPNRQYKWTIKQSVSWSPVPGGGQKFRFSSDPVTFYPLDPTPSQYNAGGRYFQKIYTGEYGIYNSKTGEFIKNGDGTLTVWLEPILA